VETSKAMRGVFPRYMESVLHFYPDLFKGYLNELFGADEIPAHVVEKLLKDKIVTQADCLKHLKSKAKSSNINNIVRIVKFLGISESEYLKDISDSVWGQITLRCLGDLGNKKHFQLLSSYALGKYDSETNYQASLALGSLVSKHFKEFIPELLKILGKCNEENTLNIYLSIKEAVVQSTIDNYGEIDKLF
jgi:hypothetical protein